jgi:hypothetical protein
MVVLNYAYIFLFVIKMKKISIQYLLILEFYDGKARRHGNNTFEYKFQTLTSILSNLKN